MATTYPAGYACSCCAIVTANADDSGCRTFCGDEHAERLAQYGTAPHETVVIDTPVGVSLFRCVGCGDDTMDESFPVLILAD